MSIIASSAADYSGYWSRLLDSSLGHPIYDLNFQQYYREVMNTFDEVNTSVVVVDKNEPVVGVAISKNVHLDGLNS